MKTVSVRLIDVTVFVTCQCILMNVNYFKQIFIPCDCTYMQRSFCRNSVRPSVKRVDCDKTK